MQRSTRLLVAVLSLVACSSRAGEVVLDGQTFTLPDGFTIERVAGPPLVDRPIVADFDEQGRLYVADSSGSSEPVQQQLAEKPHRIVRLEDTDDDGVFDRSTVFADRMMFPEGAMWHDGSLYVAAPPQIWKLTDTDDDGIADRREVWFDGRTLTGCANDLHGPYLGPDGWIYWCKGAFAEQTHELPDGSTLVTRASHIFRRHPNGGPVEPVMTGGMDNPVDVAFLPTGERFFTTTFLQHPAGGRRDGIIHAVHGGIWGKLHDPILDPVHRWTGPEVMPVMTHLGPAAPAGLTTLQTGQFGAGHAGNLMAACFNMRKVTRHELKADGATYSTTDHDFLVSDNLDFHPTDVIEDADGSLLVIDTGGWYKLCCPTSQLQKEDVLGAIYRIRREGSHQIDDPRGLEIDWDGLTIWESLSLLNDRARPAVQRRAIEMAAKQGAAVVPELNPAVGTRPTPHLRRLNAVWVATRIDDPLAREYEVESLKDSSGAVRLAALHAVSLHRTPQAVPKLIAMLSNDSPHEQRLAAEALGRIGEASAVPALLAALAEPADRYLTHALTYALIEIHDPESTAKGLASNNPAVQRAVMIALDQMGAELDARMVAARLSASDPEMREAASWIVGRHPEWGDVLAEVFRERLRAADRNAADTEALEGQLARLADARPVADLLSDTLRALREADDATQVAAPAQVALRAMAASGKRGERVPVSWIDGLGIALTTHQPEVVREAIRACRTLAIPASEAGGRLIRPLLAMAGDPHAEVDARLDALAALPGGLTQVTPEVLTLLLDQLDPDQPIDAQLAAVEILTKAALHEEHLKTLAARLPDAGPLVAGRLLAVFASSKNLDVGRALVEALRGEAVALGLRSETLRPVLDAFGPELLPQAEALHAEIAEAQAERQARIAMLLESLEGGDIRRGQEVFNSTKAACLSCHAIGYVGGKVGPDLTRIGGIRAERDLLEAIVEPSASFVQSYEPVLVATRDGRVVNGLVRGEDADNLILATGPEEEVRVPREEIDEMRPGTVSVMPSGLDQQLSAQELADLIAFLKACR